MPHPDRASPGLDEALAALVQRWPGPATPERLESAVPLLAALCEDEALAGRLAALADAGRLATSEVAATVGA